MSFQGESGLPPQWCFTLYNHEQFSTTLIILRRQTKHLDSRMGPHACWCTTQLAWPNWFIFPVSSWEEHHLHGWCLVSTFIPSFWFWPLSLDACDMP